MDRDVRMRLQYRDEDATVQPMERCRIRRARALRVEAELAAIGQAAGGHVHGPYG